jgi:hypothetical protein
MRTFVSSIVRTQPVATAVVLATDAIWRLCYYALRAVFPKAISGLRKPIAIQAAISFNIDLPERPL